MVERLIDVLDHEDSDHETFRVEAYTLMPTLGMFPNVDVGDIPPIEGHLEVKDSTGMTPNELSSVSSFFHPVIDTEQNSASGTFIRGDTHRFDGDRGTEDVGLIENEPGVC